MIERFLLLEKPRLKSYGFKRFVWRMFGIIGHTFFQRLPPETATGDGKRFLNLGAGDVGLPGFVNADFYRLHKILKTESSSWMLDITKPMKCRDEYWDGVLMEHTNEHILYSENYNLMLELLRTIKPGGVLRIVVPDLNTYLKWGELRNIEPKMNRYGSLAEAISNLTQNHLHVSVWNYELMKEMLEHVGFVNIRNAEYGVSKMEELVDSSNHKWQSLYVEAEKP